MENDLEEINESWLQRRISVLVTILLVVAVALCLYVAVQVLSYGYANLGGYMMFRVVTGSMEPSIPVGALLVAKEVEIDTIQLQDIVCFRTQLSEIWGKIVTHRVINIMQTENGSILLETKGDANLVSDIYLVDQSNFVGKVIWHTGDGSILADILSLFTSKIGFLGCIVFPALFLSGMILKDSVSNIRHELQLILEETKLQQNTQDWENDPLCGMTQQEYDQMYERIKAELMEELTQIYGEVFENQRTDAQICEEEQ